MRHTGRVLVVSDDADARDLLTASLELEGYDTETCQGPVESWDCPRIHGARCGLRERADVAVVDLDCDEDALASTKVPDDGSTVFVRRSSAPSVEREELVRATEDAQRHVKHLHGAPLLEQQVRSLDLD